MGVYAHRVLKAIANERRVAIIQRPAERRGTAKGFRFQWV